MVVAVTVVLAVVAVQVNPRITPRRHMGEWRYSSPHSGLLSSSPLSHEQDDGCRGVAGQVGARQVVGQLRTAELKVWQNEYFKFQNLIFFVFKNSKLLNQTNLIKLL
jgi:hypothetical protein